MAKAGQKGSSAAFGKMLREIGSSIGEMITGGRMEPDQELVVDVLFGLLGYLAAADSIVTSHEAEFVNGLMDELSLPTRGRELAMNAFNRGRKRQVTLEQELQRFLGTYPKGSAEVGRLYDSLLRLATADGRIRPGERKFLEKLTDGLGFSTDALEARLQGTGPRPA